MDALDVFVRAYGYAALWSVMVIQQILPLIPGEPLLLGAGAFAATGHLNVWLAAVCAVAGSVMGDLIWYEIGRLGGHRVLRRLCQLSLEPDTCVRRAEDTVARRGASALLIAKVVPGFNGIGQPLAGAIGMPRLRFILCDTLGAVLWTGLYIGLGYALRDQLAEVAGFASRLGGWAITLAVGVFAMYLGIKIIRRQLFLRQLRIARISPDELAARLRAHEPVFIVDLRQDLEVRAQPMRIRGAVHVTPAALQQRHAAIPRDREVVLYCT